MKRPSGDQAGSYPNTVSLLRAPVASSTSSIPASARPTAIRVASGENEGFHRPMVTRRSPGLVPRGKAAMGGPAAGWLAVSAQAASDEIRTRTRAGGLFTTVLVITNAGSPPPDRLRAAGGREGGVPPRENGVDLAAPMLGDVDALLSMASFDEKGLIPAIAQDATTGVVRM